MNMHCLLLSATSFSFLMIKKTMRKARTWSTLLFCFVLSFPMLNSLVYMALEFLSSGFQLENLNLEDSILFSNVV